MNCLAYFLAACALMAIATTVTHAQSPSQDMQPTYTNPIVPQSERFGADPAVIWHDGKWYMYTTNGGPYVFISDDLVHWKRGSKILPDDFRGVWAPEVYHHPEDGKFYLYYTKRYKIGVAVGDRPDGMFTDLGFIAIPGIDAHPFRDDDGRLYLYFTNTPTFTMYCIPMKTPTQPGGPVTKCFEISHDWEKHSHPINEGPWMIKRDGVYHLLYSGSDAQSIYYAIGDATAPTPIGPFTKYEGNPVFQDLPKILGPGHGSVVHDRAGQLWHVYHQKTSEKKGWARDLDIDRVAFDEQGHFGGKPTRGVALPAPIVDPNLVWVPAIHPRGAAFNRPVTVSLTCRTADAVIRYTLDGSEPRETSPKYDGPFEVNESVTVTARAWKAGMKTSYPTRQKFTHTDQPLPPNPSPNGAPGDVPFDVFDGPVKDWQSRITK